MIENVLGYINNTYMKSLSLEDMQLSIKNECDEICSFLLEKNNQYGNSVAEPINIFSKLDFIEGVKLRIDDKLKRIKNNNIDNEDSIKDLIGYLIIYRILKGKLNG